MAYDFPNAPTNGQVFTPVGGQTYTWDAAGTKWTVTGTGLSGLPTGSTTDVLTGTSGSVAVTPDALAALWEKGTAVASAATVNLGEGGYFHITGTTTITDIDFTTPKDGRVAWVIFDGALTLTNGANLFLPGGANITTAATDRACFVQDTGDFVYCLVYYRGGTYPPDIGSDGRLSLTGTGPQIILTDTSTNADSVITADNATGSLIISADINNEVGGSFIGFNVDGAIEAAISATQISSNVPISVVASSANSTFSRNGGSVHGASVLQVTRSDNPWPSGGGQTAYVQFMNLVNGEIGLIHSDAIGNATTYKTTSDGRLKPEEFRHPIDDSGAIIDALNPIYFQWASAPGHEDFGFIAQEVYEVLPGAVSVGDEGATTREDEGFIPWGMQHGRMEAMLVAELKALRARVAALEGGTAPASRRKK